jgi:tRNA-specific 2-thiouridylase
MKVIVGISGGVDSAVTALLLKQRGYEVEALFMKNWNEPAGSGQCSWETEVEDALHVCEKLDIPLNTIDLSSAYWESVFRLFLQDYSNGLTPNPDVLCNQEIKFTAFMEQALKPGADYIATGHYARIQQTGNDFRLLKGLDANKDQSYFLCRLTQQQLSRSLFPVGELEKSEVRRLAAAAGLPVHDKKDSTGICFIGERPFREFLSQYLPVRKGVIQTVEGRTIGEHDGACFYTIGQRQGLGIGGVRGQDDAPWYVADKDIDQNILYVVQGSDHPLLFRRELTAKNLHWISGNAPDAPWQCSAKTRHRQPDQACVIESIDVDALTVRFAEPQRAITPGQYVVFYQDQVCLGGGVIHSSRN